MKAVARRGVDPFLGRTRLQPIYEALHKLALAGQFYGQGNHPKLSGEGQVLRAVAAASRQCAGPPVIFDVGANVGQYAREVLQIVGPAVDLWCLEPAAATFATLKQALGDQPSVHLHNIGLSHEAGQVTLFSPARGSKLASIYDISFRLDLTPGQMGVQNVTLETLDGFCERTAVDHIHLLKLDVEGHELAVLKGSRSLLGNGAIDAIQFEFSAVNIKSRSFFRDYYELLTPRYSLFRILRDGFYPIRRYSEEQEVFKRATNYLAVRQDAPGWEEVCV